MNEETQKTSEKFYVKQIYSRKTPFIILAFNISEHHNSFVSAKKFRNQSIEVANTLRKESFVFFIFFLKLYTACFPITLSLSAHFISFHCVFFRFFSKPFFFLSLRGEKVSHFVNLFLWFFFSSTLTNALKNFTLSSAFLKPLLNKKEENILSNDKTYELYAMAKWKRKAFVRLLLFYLHQIRQTTT